MIRRFAFLFVLLLSPAVLAADGIPAGKSFPLPILLDSGKTVQAKAIVFDASSSDKPLHVFYVDSSGAVAELTYTLKRATPDPSPTPDPKPEPKPDPKPDPAPATELWGIVIEESANRTPQQAIVLASPEVRALFKDQHLRVVDPVGDDGQSVEVSEDVKAYVQRAVGQKKTWLFLVDPKGTVYYEGELPGTIEAMKALVAKYKAKGGGK